MLKEFTCGLSVNGGSFREICRGPGRVAGLANGRVRQSGQWEESSPVHHGVSVEGHEENLAATSRTDRCEEDLVVPLTKEFKSLGSLVHKDAVQMTRLHRTDLDGFLTPAHNLIRMDIGNGGRHLPPL